MRIAALAPLVLLACRPEAPPRSAADEEAGASARMLELCKAGDDGACDRLGIARKPRPAAPATPRLGQSAWSVDPTPAPRTEAAAPVQPVADAPVEPVAVDPVVPQAPAEIVGDPMPAQWVCWAARSPSGLHVGGCGATSDECESNLANTSDELIDEVIHYCSPQKKAACFEARHVLDERNMKLCFPAFEACENTRRVAAKMTKTGDYKNVSKKCRSTAPSGPDRTP